MLNGRWARGTINACTQMVRADNLRRLNAMAQQTAVAGSLEPEK
jgi:hypothetical protein